MTPKIDARPKHPVTHEHMTQAPMRATRNRGVAHSTMATTPKVLRKITHQFEHVRQSCSTGRRSATGDPLFGGGPADVARTWPMTGLAVRLSHPASASPTCSFTSSAGTRRSQRHRHPATAQVAPNNDAAHQGDPAACHGGYVELGVDPRAIIAQATLETDGHLATSR